MSQCINKEKNMELLYVYLILSALVIFLSYKTSNFFLKSKSDELHMSAWSLFTRKIGFVFRNFVLFSILFVSIILIYANLNETETQDKDNLSSSDEKFKDEEIESSYENDNIAPPRSSVYD